MKRVYYDVNWRNGRWVWTKVTGSKAVSKIMKAKAEADAKQWVPKWTMVKEIDMLPDVELVV